MEEYDLVCIGSGPAGQKAATQAGRFGHRVAVVEREVRPGGAMISAPTIASKALRETALLRWALRRRPIPGTVSTPARDLPIQKLMAQRYRIQYQEHDRIETAFDRDRIEMYRGHGRIIDPHTVSVEAVDGTDTRIAARHILIATGSSPLRPDYVPFEHTNVVDADGILELAHLPASVVVVGGGTIGCEYACMLSEIGTSVTLIDPRAELLGFLDPECRDHLVRAMTDAGIEIRLNTRVTTVVPPDDSSVCVRLDDGEELTCELLLWAAGRCSNTADIGLENVGIETGRRGLIPVNERYQTRIPNIYAAGDSIGFPALAATSMEQGRIAACVMFGIDFKKKLAATLPISLYTIPAVSMVGLTQKQAQEAGCDTVVGRAAYRNNPRGRMLGDEEGLVKCVFDTPSRRLLGATIVGQDATELIHLAQFVIGFEGGINDLIDACFNYPSLAELYKHAAYDALGSIAINEDRRGRGDERAQAA